MGSVGPWQILIVLALALLLFGGAGRISGLMGDFAKGIKAFRKGLEDDDEADKRLEEKTAAPAAEPSKETEKTGA